MTVVIWSALLANINILNLFVPFSFIDYEHCSSDIKCTVVVGKNVSLNLLILQVVMFLKWCICRWMEVCLEEELPPTTELEEGLRNGVYLAKLAKFFAPNVVSDKKIYDVEQARYKVIILFTV